MYLQDGYSITTTTNINTVKSFVKSSHFDIIIFDTEPSPLIESICKEIKQNKPNTSIFLTYVFKNQIKEFECTIRKYVNSIFYKPFDLNEVSLKLSSLAV